MGLRWPTEQKLLVCAFYRLHSITMSSGPRRWIRPLRHRLHHAIFVSFLLHFFLLRFLAVSAQPLLFPTGSATKPFGTDWVIQTAFDFHNDTLYLVNTARHNIVKLAGGISSTPIPLTGAWTYELVSGSRYGNYGPAQAVEVGPSDASFFSPTGIAGWPSYVVGPMGSVTSWVGLWIADSGNNALRLINFCRGGNVTLVAGSPSGAPGGRDGIGINALLRTPSILALGRFLLRTALGYDDNGMINPKAWTSVVFWSDRNANCLRQGIPLHNDSTFSYFSTATSAVDLVLNVTGFVGRCEDSSGSGTGLAFNRVGMLSAPWGIVLALPSSYFNTTFQQQVLQQQQHSGLMILFVGEHLTTYRISMISPMYPSSARFLTPVYTDTIQRRFTGLTVLSRLYRGNDDATLLHTTPGNATTSTISTSVWLDIIAANDDHATSPNYINVSICLTYRMNITSSSSTATTTTMAIQTNSSSEMTIVPNAGTSTVFASTGILHTWDSIFIPYRPNSTVTGTLVVFSGYGNAVLQFYCCLDPMYSAEPQSIQDGYDWKATAAIGGSERTQTLTQTGSPSWGTSSHRMTMKAGNQSRMSRRTASASRPSCSNSPSAATSSLLSTSRNTGIVRRGQPNTTHSATRSLPPAATGGLPLPPGRNRSTAPPSTSLFADAVGVVQIVASPSSPGMLASTFTSVAASKAAVAGRTFRMWECISVGPAKVAANDPQQFLGFGLGLGEGQEATARGALILTSLVRVAMIILLLLVAKFQAPGRTSRR